MPAPGRNRTSSPVQKSSFLQRDHSVIDSQWRVPLPSISLRCRSARAATAGRLSGRRGSSMLSAAAFPSPAPHARSGSAGRARTACAAGPARRVLSLPGTLRSPTDPRHRGRAATNAPSRECSSPSSTAGVRSASAGHSTSARSGRSSAPSSPPARPKRCAAKPKRRGVRPKTSSRNSCLCLSFVNFRRRTPLQAAKLPSATE